jgi:hypothetical protein
MPHPNVRVRGAWMRLRRTAVLVVATGAIVAPAPLAHPASAPASALKTCRHGFVRGVIGGAEKCLHAGEYCAIRYAKQYRRYGFRCSGSPARLH